MYMRDLRALIATWVNASQRSRDSSVSLGLEVDSPLGSPRD